ncbi:MAG TPA: acyl-CoA dehydrogenase family protein [Planctomycetota bacterium]|jgi:glutaryl-CoA dehydrogenase|nr:acyl-CoA dehydrogenase [Planctomycetota bacterium]MDP7245700.1 acyl-CoA dehydrogenase family protein [Planctomycetota bacterium]HJM38676.1 acyl-CoA dehydrogenase family protein [Planctomycetota bacterium]|tara:strand:+ start:2420 stop:3598 length:1179 start_codon:yes stop_codon:yes gene_type:complete
MASFTELDFYNLSSLLAEDDLMVRDMVRSYCTDKLMPIVAEHWEAGTFPTPVIKEMGELGLLGPSVAEEYGGAGMSAIQYGIICQEIERVDSGLRSFNSVQGSLVMYPVEAFGSEEQKKEWLPKLASGDAVGCFGLTEPDFGSDPAGMRTRCRRDGDDWILDGQKMWITNGSMADMAIVWAKDDEGIVQGFIVETEREGFSAPEQKHKWSLRCSVTSELVMEGVRVPEVNRLPNTSHMKSPLSCLTQARYGIAWGAVGAMQACFDEALRYTQERKIYDKPLAGFQLTADKLAEIATEITKAQLLAFRLGQMKDAGTMSPKHVSMAKRNNVAKALEIAHTCRTLLGANGITLEYQAGRHMCNLETVLTYEGTHEIHSLILGHALSGVAPYGDR